MVLLSSLMTIFVPHKYSNCKNRQQQYAKIYPIPLLLRILILIITNIWGYICESKRSKTKLENRRFARRMQCFRRPLTEASPQSLGNTRPRVRRFAREMAGNNCERN